MKFDASIAQTRWQSPYPAFGSLILASTTRGLAGVWFEGQKHLPDMAGWPQADAHPVLLAARSQLAEYFAGQRQRFDLPLDLSGGTPFQQTVWQALLNIAPGATTSYGALAAGIGKPAAVRALGAAVGRNPVSIIVPCHRVVGMGGALTGYAGGLPRKTALLQLERPSA